MEVNFYWTMKAEERKSSASFSNSGKGLKNRCRGVKGLVLSLSRCAGVRRVPMCPSPAQGILLLPAATSWCLGDTLHALPGIRSGWQGGDEAPPCFSAAASLAAHPPPRHRPRRCAALLHAANYHGNMQRRQRPLGKNSFDGVERTNEAADSKKIYEQEEVSLYKLEAKLHEGLTGPPQRPGCQSQGQPATTLLDGCTCQNPPLKHSILGKSDAVRQEAAICCRRASESVRRRR